MPVNLAELLTAAAQRHPDRVALVEPARGRRLTWAELDAEVDALAGGFALAGLVAGNRVAIVLGNRVELVACYLAALRARLVAVPVNPRAATGELVRTLVDSRSRLVVGDATTLTSVRSAATGLQDALVGADAALASRAVVPRVAVLDAPTVTGEVAWVDLTASERGAAAALPPATDEEALAVLLYTSGTSGPPRAAMLTHRAMLANVDQVAATAEAMVGSDDVVFGVLPLFHVYGLNAVLGQVLRQAARLVLVDGFDVEGSLDVIHDEGVTVVPVAPPVFAYWRGVDGLAERLSGVRLLLSGSAPLDPDVADEFTARTGIAVHEGYGLTEAAPVVTSTLVRGTRGTAPKRGSVGAPLPGVELRLGDDGGATGPEDPAEVQVRGPNLFSGYWPDGADGPDAEGWWRTGDIGYLDADGDLFLVDRLKELVLVSGFNVYPVEVEDAIAELDDVEEVAVIGQPDPATGEAVVAYVRRRPGADVSEAELAERVRLHSLDRLARFKQPKTVHVVDELPHTVTGKVAKGRLRAAQRRRVLGLVE